MLTIWRLFRHHKTPGILCATVSAGVLIRVLRFCTRILFTTLLRVYSRSLCNNEKHYLHYNNRLFMVLSVQEDGFDVCRCQLWWNFAMHNLRETSYFHGWLYQYWNCIIVTVNSVCAVRSFPGAHLH